MSGFVKALRHIRVKQQQSINVAAPLDTNHVNNFDCSTSALNIQMCIIGFCRQVFEPLQHNQHSDLQNSKAENALEGCQVSQKIVFYYYYYYIIHNAIYSLKQLTV